MEELDQIIKAISMTLGAAWASGINLYATILVLGLLGITESITLPPGLVILMDPLVLGAAGIMYFVEFFADKIPGLDTAWDSIHTFIRIPAGVLLAVGASSQFGDVNPAVVAAAALIAGGLTTGVHATKAGARVLINTSPEPFTNWVASVGEDAAVVAGLWTALHYPLVFIGFLIVFVLLMAWVIPKLWRGIKKVFGAIKRMFSGNRAEPQNP